MSTPFETSRRGFLKGAAASLAGLFVVTNPQLMAANEAELHTGVKAVESGLLLPRAEPMIFQARELPQKVTHAGEAFVYSIDIRSNMIDVTMFQDVVPRYLQGLPPDIDLHLKVIPGKTGSFFDIQAGDTVRLFVVKEKRP